MWTFISALAAAVAVIIAYLQWKTAQTKVVLDIHATRYAIYQDLRDAVTMFLQEVKFSNEVARKFLDAQSRARFHFGAEVEEYLERLRRDMICGATFDRYGPLDARANWPLYNACLQAKGWTSRGLRPQMWTSGNP